jgi:hypothetical protein
VTRKLGLLAWGALLSAAGGCAGSGRIEVASLNFNNVDPPGARFSVIKADRCYWWADEQGRVWIGLEREFQYPFLGPLGHFHFQLSLMLERLPAGRARNYTAAKRELRAVARVGPTEMRFASLSGIAALYRESGNRMRGSMRLLVSREVSRLLGGWSRPTRYLLLGTFIAVHDPVRGRRIAEATESSGWQRGKDEAAATTAPAVP